MVVLIRALLGLGHQVLQAMPPCPSFDCICSVNIPLVGRVEKRGRAMLPTSSTHKGHTVHPTPSWSIFFPAQIVQHEYEPSRLSTVALPDLPTPSAHCTPVPTPTGCPGAHVRRILVCPGPVYSWGTCGLSSRKRRLHRPQHTLQLFGGLLKI